MKRQLSLAGFAVLSAVLVTASPAAESIPVSIRVDAGRPQGELKPIWRFFGADEPNYAYMKHGRKLLTELGQLRPEQVYFRAHNLLTSGDGTPALKWGSTGVSRALTGLCRCLCQRTGPPSQAGRRGIAFASGP
jgi:xylan 1,4-beta-xylosidase